MKKQPTEWEKIFIIDETNRTYFPKYANNSKKKKKTTTTTKKKTQKNDRRYKWTSFQRRHTGGQ